MRDSSVAEKPDPDFVQSIGEKIFRGVPGVGEHLLFGVKPPLGVDPDEVVRQDALECRGVSGGDRLGPFPRALDDVLLSGLLSFHGRALAESQAKKAAAEEALA